VTADPLELQSALGLANEAEAETEGREEADGTYPHSRNKLQTIDWPVALQWAVHTRLLQLVIKGVF
jgi:hypothetical protein